MQTASPLFVDSILERCLKELDELAKSQSSLSWKREDADSQLEQRVVDASAMWWLSVSATLMYSPFESLIRLKDKFLLLQRLLLRVHNRVAYEVPLPF